MVRRIYRTYSAAKNGAKARVKKAAVCIAKDPGPLLSREQNAIDIEEGKSAVTSVKYDLYAYTGY